MEEKILTIKNREGDISAAMLYTSVASKLSKKKGSNLTPKKKKRK